MQIIQLQRQKRTGLVKISLTERKFVNCNKEEYDLLGVINHNRIENIYNYLKRYRICETFYYLSDRQVKNML